MRITRRDFLKYCAMTAGALGLSTTDLMKIEKALATDYPNGTHVVWLNGAACTGCTVTLANSVYYASVHELLAPYGTAAIAAAFPELATLGLTANGPLDLDFMETLSGSVGANAVNSAYAVLSSSEPFALCLEGSIQTEEDGKYCEIWNVSTTQSNINADSLVFASADRAELGVSNDTSEKIVLVSTRTLSGAVASTAGTIRFAPGSVLLSASALANGSWFESAADRTASGLTFNADNKVTGGTMADVTLTGRVEAAATTAFAGGEVATSNTYIYSSTDRASFGGTYTYAPRATANMQVNNDLTLSGKIWLDTGTVLASGTILNLGTWVEASADRTALPDNYDADNKITISVVTVGTTITLAGRVELAAGSVLKAQSAGTSSYAFGVGEDRTFAEEVLNFAISSNCKVVIAVGTCASFGGIPAANGSVTGARGLITAKSSGGYAKVNNVGYWDLLKSQGKISAAQWTSLMAKTVCVSGCPPHPDWIVGTIVNFLALKSAPLMDKYHRPLDFYQEYQCTNCLWKTNKPGELGTTHSVDNSAKVSQSGRTTGNSPLLYRYKYASSYEGCIGILGCKGRKTKADCSYRKWNATAKNGIGTGWCVQTRAGCHGCTDPRFPDGWGKFFSYK